MRVGVFSAKSHDRSSLGEANARAPAPHELVFLDARLARETAPLGAAFPSECAFVNDRLDADRAADRGAGSVPTAVAEGSRNQRPAR